MSKSVIDQLVRDGTISSRARGAIDRRFSEAEEALEIHWASYLADIGVGVSHKAATRMCEGATHEILERLKMWLFMMAAEDK